MPIKISIHIDKRSTFLFTHWWLMLSAINMADNNITVRMIILQLKVHYPKNHQIKFVYTLALLLLRFLSIR